LVTDGDLISNSVWVTLDRGINLADATTHEHALMSDHAIGDLVAGVHDHSDSDTIYITGSISGTVDSPVNELDVLHMNPAGNVSTIYSSMEMHREGGDLHMSLSGSDELNGSWTVEAQVCNQYGFESGTVEAPETNYLHSIEFVRFAQGSEYMGYQFNALGEDPNCGCTDLIETSGFYAIALELEGAQGNYNELIVGSDASGESLIGNGGNDLLFAHGEYANLDGGTGNDLLVADGENAYLCGDEGSDTLVANACGSTLVGGMGDDHLVIGSNEVTIDLSVAEGMDTVDGFFENSDSQINLSGFVDFVDTTETTDFLDSLSTLLIGDLTDDQKAQAVLDALNGVVIEDFVNFFMEFTNLMTNANLQTSQDFVPVIPNFFGISYSPDDGSATLFGLMGGDAIATFNNVAEGAFQRDNFATLPV